jgi:beta-lactamase regulating signal transducer with metallopeptidase domain
MQGLLEYLSHLSLAMWAAFVLCLITLRLAIDNVRTGGRAHGVRLLVEISVLAALCFTSQVTGGTVRAALIWIAVFDGVIIIFDFSKRDSEHWHW